jgi:hypothetical protein
MLLLEPINYTNPQRSDGKKIKTGPNISKVTGRDFGIYDTLFGTCFFVRGAQLICYHNTLRNINIAYPIEIVNRTQTVSCFNAHVSVVDRA